MKNKTYKIQDLFSLSFRAISGLAVVGLFLMSLNASAQFSNVPLTSGTFNKDIVADDAVGAGTNSTTAAVDGIAVGSFVFVSPTFNAGAGVCAAGATALPASLSITSTNATTATGITYTLQSFGSGLTTNNNAFQLSSTLTTGTLTPVSNFSASKLYFVCLGGGGATTFNLTVNFTNATSQSINGLVADDWCSATATNRLTAQQYYRIARNATTCTGALCQYLFEIPGTILATNYGKTISSINVTWVSGGFLCIMAMGAQAPCTTPNASPSFSTPLSSSGSISQITGTITAASPVPTGGYLVVRYPAGTGVITAPVTGTTYTTGSPLGLGTVVQSGAATSITATGLTGGTAYDFYVYSYNTAANCGGPVYSTALSQTNVSTAPCGGPVSPTTVSIGPGLPNTLAGGFTSIANALGTGFPTSLGTTGTAAPVILELLNTYTSEVSTTSLVITNNACFTPINNLTIRPAAGANGLNITSSVAGPTIDLDGAKYVTFDGTPGGTVGTPAMAPIAAGTNNATNLNIKNTSTTGVAMRFKNDAANNKVMYCDLQGSNSAAPLVSTTAAVLADRGVVFIGTAAITGNDNVIIDHCNIHPAVANATMTMGVYSYSTQASAPVPAFNDACQITNNNIYDIYGGTALGSTGIGLAGGTDSWTITGNSFFQTASRTPVLTAGVANRAIFLAPTNPGTGQGNNFIVTGNYIGGTTVQCGGTAMTLNATGAFNNNFTAIEISVAGGAATNAKSNTITNMNISQAANTGDIMRAFSISNNGNVNIGGPISADGNIIGSSTATSAIVLTSTSAALSHMILLGGSPTSSTNILVQNNKIGGVRTAGTGTSLTGIFCNNSATINIDANLIGSTTVLNSFEASGNTTTAQFVNGIRIPSGSCTATITNNTICNLNNNSTSTTAVSGNSATVPPQTGGIIITGSTTTVIVQSINNNTIRNLSNAAPTGSNLQSAALVGIGTNSTSATAMTISGNTIDSLFSTATTGSVLIEGISYFGSTSNNNIISGNFIHSIGVNAASTTASIRGIECATGAVSVVNNMIRLGILANGSSLTNPITIYGMLNSATTQNFYYNSVYIGGTGVIAGANNTFAFWRNSTLAANAKNNIFYNARSGAGAGKHFSIYFTGATSFTNVLALNNNIYLANGTNGQFAFNGTANVASYTPGWFTGDLNSIYGDPVLLNPTGTATGVSPTVVNLHCNTAVGSAAESGGVAISGINNDIDGDVRQGSVGYVGTGIAPDIGADEFAGILALPTINSVSISPTATLCSAVTHAVTANVTAASGSTITSVTINYSVNGVAQTGIVMTLTSGAPNATSVWDGIIPIPTPTNATIIWSVTAGDGSFFKTATGGTYFDEPLTGVTALASASANPICAGVSSVITASLSKPLTANIGAGATTSLTYPNPIYSNWANNKMQILYLPAELSAAGFVAGSFSSMSLNLTATNTTARNGFTIQMANVGATALTTTFLTPSLTQVYTNNYVPFVGLNTFAFGTGSGSSSTFNWDGVSSVLIQICWDNTASTLTLSSTCTADNTSFASVVSYNRTSTTGTPVCGLTVTGLLTYTVRPRLTFTANAAPAITNYLWSEGSTTSSITVAPVTSTNYSCTVTAAGCTATTNTLILTVNPAPTVPTTTPSTQCGIGIPAASVTSTSGLGGPQFYWYSASTGGSLMQTPPLGNTLTPYYSNDFSSATLTNSSIGGAAAISGGALVLQPTTTSSGGSITVNASGINSSIFQTDFDLSLIATGTTIADGFSYSFADDAVPSYNTTPTAEHGNGSKLRLCFMTYNGINTGDGKGIYLVYNTTATSGYTVATPGVLAYSTDVSWIPVAAGTVSSHVTASINALGQLTLIVGANTIFTNVQLPAGFLSADKSNWKHVFCSRSGGVAGGYAMDNLVIQANTYGAGYTTYQQSISTPTTFYVIEKDPASGCESSPRTALLADVTTGDLVTPVAQISGSNITQFCVGNTFQLSTTQTGGNLNNYTYTWTASSSNSGISGSVSGGTFSSPSTLNITPLAAGTYIYTVSYTDGLCNGVNTISITVNPLPSITSAIASPNPICLGTSTTLTALTGTTATVNATIGNGATTTTAAHIPFYRTFEGSHKQFLYTAAEMTAAGFTAGNFSNLTIPVTAVSAALNFDKFGIRMANTSATSLAAFQTPTLTNCYYTSSTIPIAGNNSYPFSTPFTWDGTSNVLLDISFDNDSTSACSGCWGGTFTEAYTTTAFTSCVYYYADNLGTTARQMQNITTVTGTSTLRPNFTFTGTASTSGPGTFNWQWNPGAFNSNVAVVSPSGNTTYTVTATNPATSCSSTSTASVTVIPIPSAPTSPGATQCGYGVPTAVVTSTSGLSTPTFKWYSAASGGTLLQTSTSNTYGLPINATTTFYVTELSGICESSPRTPVVVTVNQPDAVTILSANASCIGTALPFSANKAAGPNTYVYTWSASPSVGSGVSGSPTGANQTFTPTATGTYIYTLFAYDAATNCTTLDTQSVIVYTGLSGSVTATQILSCVYPTGLITTNVSGAGTVVNNDFTSSTLPSYMTIQGSASITGGELVITPTSSGQSGSVLVQNTTGLANNDFQIDFDFITKGPAGIPFGPTAADGLSYSYGDDVVAGTYQNVTNGSGNIGYPSNSPIGNVAEGGSGTKLKISFDPWENGTGTLSGINGGVNYAGIYFMYNCTDYFNATQSPTGATANDNARGVLAFSPATWWRATSTQTATPVNTTHVTIVMAGAEPGFPNGSTTLTLTGTTGLAQGNVFGPLKVALPAGYLAADKSTWKHVFAARTGGNWEGHAIDNLSIRYNNFYEYSIDNGTSWSQTTPIVPPTSGIYPVLARYVSVPGCFAPIGTAVIDAPSFTTTTTASNICAYSATQPTLSFTPVFGSGATYQWESASPPGSGNWVPINGATATTYTPPQGSVLVNTDFHCVIRCSGTPIPGSPTTTITITSEAPVVNNTTPLPTRCGPGSVDLVADVSLGATPMWYTASSGGTAFASGSPYSTPNLFASTTYYVSAAMPSGCESGRTAVAVIINPSTPITLAGTATICEGDNITLSASSANDPNYVYNWNPGGFVGAIYQVTPPSTTTYTVTAIDNSNNCQDIKTVTVTVNQRPAINSITSSAPILCSGSSAQLNVSATAANNAFGPVAVTGFNNDIVAGGEGSNSILGTTYSFGVDGAGYFFMDNTYKYVSTNALPTCYMPVNKLAPSLQTPGLTYVLQDYGSGATLNNNAMSIANASNGSYVSPLSNTGTLALTTPKNYTTLKVLYETVVNTAPLSVDATVNFTDATTESFPGNTCVNWFTTTLPAFSGMGRTTPAGVIQCAATPNMFELNLPISIANQNKQVASITFSIPTVITASFEYNINYFHAMAVGGSTSLTYAWSPATGLSSTSVSNPTASPSVNTTYTVTVSESGTGCTRTATVSVSLSAMPQPKIVEGDTAVCGNSPGYYLHVIDTGAYASGYPYGTYFDWVDWTGPVFGLDSFLVNSSYAYKVVVTLPGNYGSCYDTSNVVQADFTGAQAPVPLIDQDSVDCFGESNGMAIVNLIVGGDPLVNYKWYNSSNVLLRNVTTTSIYDTLKNLPVGIYTVVVTNNLGTTFLSCEEFASVEVLQPDPLSASENTSNHINNTCYESLGGVIDIEVSGGTADYYYNWSNGATTEDLNGVATGTYTVTVSDYHGCSFTLSSTISSPTLLTVVCSHTDVTCNGYHNGTGLIVASGGTEAYHYQWDNGATTAAISNLAPGDYCATVTDGHGCMSSCCIQVTEPNLLAINGSLTNVTCKNAKDGTITLNPSGGTSPYSYIWNNGSGSQNRTALAPGTYTVLVIDAHGCSTTGSFTIVQSPTILTINVVKTNIQCGGKCTGSATANPVGGTGPFTYLWSNTSTSSGIINLCAGTYTVTVTDAYHCVKTVVVPITQNPVLVLVAAPSGPTQATATVSGGVSPYTYSWNTSPPQASATATGLFPGSVYKIKVTDKKGCTKIANVSMPVPRNVSNDGSASGMVAVYPNPTTGHVTVEFKEIQSGINYSIKLLDITGREIFYQSAVKSEGVNKVDYEFGTLPKGIYTMLIITDKDFSLVKIIIQ